MKITILIFALAVTVSAANYSVCASGCSFATAQLAANQTISDQTSPSYTGDTIVIQAGYNAGDLIVPGGWHNVTIKSSAIDGYPRGYRILRGGCMPWDLSVEAANPANGFSCASGNPSVLGRLTEVQTGDAGLFLTAAGGVGTTTLTNMPSNFPTAHGLSVGEQIVVNAALYSGFYCGPTWTGSQPAPWNNAGSSCTPSNAGLINVRTNTQLSNVQVLYFLGRTLPPPLRLNTPYYVVNFTAGGPYPQVADTFQLSATSGGAPIAIPYYRPENQDFVIEYSPLPVRNGTTLFVASTPSTSTLTLSLTKGGPAIVWAQSPYTYNGGGFSRGWQTYTVNPVHDITIDGIEVAPAADAGIYYPFWIQGNCGFHSFACENYNINVWRSWIHGSDDQIDFPAATINISGNNLDIEGNVIEGAYFTANDSQGVGFLSTGHVNIVNNDIKGSTENILSGGNTPWFAYGYNTVGINVTRNFIWKPLKAFIGLEGIYKSPSTFALLPRYPGGNANDCSNAIYNGVPPAVTAATTTIGSAKVIVASGAGIGGGMTAMGPGIPIGTVVASIAGTTVTLTGPASAGGSVSLTFYNSPPLYYQCFGYEAQETPNTSTPPANPSITVDHWTQNQANSTFSVTGSSNGQVGLLYWIGGVIHMDYNFSGTVSCPSGVACAFVANPWFPTASSRIGIACVGSNTTYDCQSPNTGAFDGGTFFGAMRVPFTKNLIESKYGDNWLIEGNVFHRSINCDSGEACQGPANVMTNGINGSGNGEAVNWSTSTSYSTMRHNLYRMASQGANFVGQSFALNLGAGAYTWEWAGFGAGTNNTLQNNIFQDLGSSEYTDGGTQGQLVAMQFSPQLSVVHNTGVDLFSGLVSNGLSQYLTLASNVLTPYRTACPGNATGACTQPATTSEIGVQYDPGTAPIPQFAAPGQPGWVPAVNTGLYIDSTAVWGNNLAMNREGYVYYTGTPAYYPPCGLANLSCSYLNPITSGSAASPTVLFANWQERSNTQPPNGLPYRNADLRLASGQSALYPSADSRVIGADTDEVNSFIGGLPAPGISGQANGTTGSDVENGWPQFNQRTGRQIIVGSTTATIGYLSDGYQCTIQIWPNANYSGASTINTNDAGATILDGMITVPLTGLSPSTYYQGKRLCGPAGAATEADIVSFTTNAATPSQTFSFAPPAGVASCAIQYGPTVSLGSSTSSVTVSGGLCAVTVPPTTYWRQVYLNGSGVVVNAGDIREAVQ